MQNDKELAYIFKISCY